MAELAPPAVERKKVWVLDGTEDLAAKSVERLYADFEAARSKFIASLLKRHDCPTDWGVTIIDGMATAAPIAAAPAPPAPAGPPLPAPPPAAVAPPVKA